MQLNVQKGQSDWIVSMETILGLLDELRCVSMVLGVLFVITSGMKGMLAWCVECWASPHKVF